MTRRAGFLTAFTLAFALSTPNDSRAGFVTVGPGAKFITGVDAGVGPGFMPADSPNLNSVDASNTFHENLGPNTSTTVNFGSAFTGLKLSQNNSWSGTVTAPESYGLKAESTGIDSRNPPAHYQYGQTSTIDSVASNKDIGYGVGGPSRYEFVPVSNAGTASYTIHSDKAFESFGLYVTGLGNSFRCRSRSRSTGK